MSDITIPESPPATACGVIAFVSLEIYPTTAGGVGILLHHTIRFLLQQGYEIVLLLDIQEHEFERYRTIDRMELENGHNLHVYHVGRLCENTRFPCQVIPHPEILRSARISAALERICSRHDVEMVEFYDYCGPAYYFLGNTLPHPPAIAIRLHNTIELIARKIRSVFDPERVIQFAAERSALAGADLVLSSGPRFYDEEMAALYPEIARERVHMSAPLHAPIGMIDYSSFANDVVFYGRLSTFKGLDVFIKGAVMALRDPEFSDWLGKFLIIGPEETVASTYSLDDMKRFIPDDLMGRFEFAGRVDHAALLRRLGNAAFACFANRMESFCYAAHELHTAGVPLILSDTPAFRDHFEDGSQALFFDRTALGLSEQMIALAQDRDHRLKLSEAGLSRAKSYLVDHYADHLEAARAARAARVAPAVALRPDVLILSDGNRKAVKRSLAALEEMQTCLREVFVLTLDTSGAFLFSGQRWRLETPEGRSVDGAMFPAPEAAWIIRAGDLPQGAWLEHAAALLNHRADVGAVAGWLLTGLGIEMTVAPLLPESASTLGLGLRMLLRLNPRDTLQDGLMSRPDDSEASMLLARRARGQLLLTLPEVACDIERAIDLPTQSLRTVLEYDFDRFSRDHMAQMFLDSTVSNAAGDVLNADLERSRREKGFFSLRTLEAENDADEILLLRFFPEPGSLSSSWDALRLDGDWTVRRDPGGPVKGALRAVDGQVRGHVRMGGGFDLLKSPFAGRVEIMFNGKRRIIDLKAEKIASLRIQLNETGIQAGDVSNEADGGLALRNLPEVFVETGQCRTLILTEHPDDLRDWPGGKKLRDLILLAEPELFERARPDLSLPLTRLIHRMGTTRLLFSSRLVPGPQLQQALAELPDDLQLGLALCGSDSETPMLVRAAAWFGCLRPYMDRLTCLGGAAGLREVFASAGAECQPVPLLHPVRTSPEVDPTTPVSLALLASEHQPQNIMHMLNAVLLAQQSGLEISVVYLPDRFREDLAIFESQNLTLPVEFYVDVAALALVGEGCRRVAMACYPQEDFPAALSRAAALGWLPLAGATGDLDGAPDGLGARLTEPYWENSALIADRLLEICAEYAALEAAYTDFALQEQEQGRQNILTYLDLNEVDKSGGMGA